MSAQGSDYVQSSEEDTPSRSSAHSPIPNSGQASTCQLCQTPFSVTTLKHRCRVCQHAVCGACSRHRIRLEVGGTKERVCDSCGAEWRASHAEQLEEAADVRAQMNSSLKALLKEKYEEVETLKRVLVDLIEAHQYLQEPPKLTGPARFSSEMGMGRINFSELVKYLDDRVKFLKARTIEIQEAVFIESAEQDERTRNYGFLQERTDKAEADANRVAELSLQRDRLKATYREQAARVRALRDRVDILESNPHSRLPGEDNDEVQDDSQPDFVGDRFAEKLFPCLR